jgi:hypothetical protein
MSQIINEPKSRKVVVTGDARGRIRPGLVFVPCALCSMPVDLGLVFDPDQPQLCANHLEPHDLHLH